MKKIQLSDVINTNIYVLSGRPNGEEARKKLSIEAKDLDKEIYEIIIPYKIRTFNPSYFLGLFSLSIKKIGIVKFRKKYLFVSDIENKNLKKGIITDLEEGIEWALEDSDVLH